MLEVWADLPHILKKNVFGGNVGKIWLTLEKNDNSLLSFFFNNIEVEHGL